jgi:PAS domain-containing protein
MVDYLKDNPHFRHTLLDSNMIDILPCGLSISTDISCETIIHNKIAAKFYGIQPYEVFSHSAKEPPPVRIYQNGKLLSVEEMPIQRAAWYGIETYACTLDFVWDKGISTTALISAVPLRDENKVIIGCISTLEDISSFVNLNRGLDEKNQLLKEEIQKVRAAEESIANSEEKYHSLFSSMNESFCIIEMLFDSEERPINWRYLETNPAFRENALLKDVEGKLIRDMIPDL